MPKAYIAGVRNHFFFGNNSRKSKPIETKFYSKTSAHVTLTPANFWRPPPNGHKRRRKKIHFANFDVSETTYRLAHFPTADFCKIKFELKTWIGVSLNSFGTELRTFSDMGSSPPKSSFWGFLVHLDARAPALAFRSTANLSNSSYSRRIKGLFLFRDFFPTSEHFREIGMQIYP